MSKFIKYIKRYWRSTKSLAGGLKTSIKVFFRKKVTEQYPENRHTTPNAFPDSTWTEDIHQGVLPEESDGAVSGKPAYDALHTGTSSGTVGNDS